MIAPTVLEQTERIAQIGSWEWDLVSDTGTGSAGFFRIHGTEHVGAINLNDILGPVHPEDRPALEQAFLDAETSRALQEAARQLKPREQQFLRMYFYEELPKEEIARKLGINEERIRLIKSRALQSFREIYKKISKR